MWRYLETFFDCAKLGGGGGRSTHLAGRGQAYNAQDSSPQRTVIPPQYFSRAKGQSMEGLAPAQQRRLKCPLWNLFKTDLWARLKQRPGNFFQNSQEGTLTSPRGHHPQPWLTPLWGPQLLQGVPLGSRLQNKEFQTLLPSPHPTPPLAL